MGNEIQNYRLRADEVADLDPYERRSKKKTEIIEAPVEVKAIPESSEFKENYIIPPDSKSAENSHSKIIKGLRFLEYSSAAALILDLQLFALTRGETPFRSEQALGGLLCLAIFILTKAGADKYEDDLN
ncbi:MAG: hypothetical protein A3B38_04510 [Candidatus Levybacteria bacterium RIFCSPLOWO2_01_FULL_36_13]|nr:MAG: hypothetical protein A2684_00260 [Candidatus Levybacteria bacterium RIFCSPHIGHO2_01_FULL_36_15b]OGH34091.1 MAG: hypothetical protein A3B38_04510 [Candidatus Levybacteria bacterium RIFCSPLOWO2_01_FULL_36_13]